MAMTSNDIYQILVQQPHNKHYLQRYFRFILSCQSKNATLEDDEYVERHHICPNSLFPEYGVLADNQWNCSYLTARQHYIAHWILARAYGGGMWYALFMMTTPSNGATQKRHYHIHSKTYAEARENLKGVKRVMKDRESWMLSRIGKSVFKDSKGNRHYLETNDPKIEELGLVGHTKGVSTMGVNEGHVVCIDTHTGEHTRVKKSEFDSSDRYVGLNHGKKTTEGKVWIKSPDSEFKIVDPDTLDEYLSQGYIKESPHKGKVGESKGTIWMNDGTTNVRCDPKEQDHYESLGYTRGRVKGFKWKKKKGA